MNEMSSPVSQILDAWFSRKPTFALMGEYSAGKSTLLNLLLGGNLLPTQITATNMPVIWITYGETASGLRLTRDGVLSPFKFSEFDKQGAHDSLLLRLTLPADILKRIDILDTPGISDPRLALGALNFLGAYLDFGVWCTAANQAWRQSEKAMWSTMPTHVHEASLLAITRADIITSEKNLKKVIRRCEKEAGDYFSAFAPIATLSALAARDDNGEITDQDLWESSHADAFLAYLNQCIDDAEHACAQRPNLEIPQAVHQETPIVESIDPVVEVVAEVSTAEVTETVGITPSGAGIEHLLADLKAMHPPVDTIMCNDQFFTKLRHLFNTFICETDLPDAQATVFRRMMPSDEPGALPQTEVIKQLRQEVADFATSDWCVIDP